MTGGGIGTVDGAICLSKMYSAIAAWFSWIDLLLLLLARSDAEN